VSDPARHARASALFLELRALPAAEREEALERGAGVDPELRAEVRSLLLHDDGAPPPAWPARIGPYRLLERIGQGGTGLVFLAEQEEPVRRRVALKIVPAAAHNPELAARFEVERRALEATDHPGIARILDAGRTGEGLPYLVMDYVEGSSITEHCERAGMGLDRRIDLVLEVAGAVQHAHQRGVIHRDLKPANILVSRADARPRLVDFGIAKAVAGGPGGGAPRTSGMPIGTPAYMAPEQTGLGGVDTRADVYALGAVLYELVAGRPPVDATGDLLAVLRRIREEVPPPASRARAGGGAAPGASRASRRDLDCILAKALEKAPERRYPTVGALMEDLGRLRRREPVEARPPARLYRAARFAQRNRVLVAALSAAAATLLVGVLGLALGLFEARRQRATALDQMDAQAELNRFLTDDLLAAASPDRAGPNASVLDVLNAASAHIEERFPTRPLVAAAVHHALGEAFAVLGAFDPAQEHLARAIALRRASGGSDSPDTVRSEIAAASLIARRERYAEARPALEAAVMRARLVLGPDDRDLYAALNDLGVALEGLGQLDAAEAAFDEALAGRTRLLGPRDKAVLETVGNLAFVHDGRGDTEGALGLMRSGLAIAESLPDPPRMALLGFNNNIGATYQDLGRDAEAAPYLRRAAEIASELLGPDHPDTLTIRGNLASLEAELGRPERAAELFAELASARAETLGPGAPDTLFARYGYFDSLEQAGRHAEAAAGFEALCADAEAALGPDHWLAPQTQSARASALYGCGRAEEALPLAEAAEARLRALLGPEHHRVVSAHAVSELVRGGR
jgi:tetratricopeptide (TPR) repeat protein